MWDCRSCGCKAIAGDVRACPHCGIARKELTMARISVHSGPSNSDGSVEVPIPPRSALKEEHVRYAVDALGMDRNEAEGLTKDELVSLEHPEDNEEKQTEGDEEGSSSAGSSSSQSGSKQDKSGSTPQETGSSIQSPAPDAESPSDEPQQPSQDSPSTARSTGGATRRTGRSQPDPQNSLEETSPGTTTSTKGGSGKSK